MILLVLALANGIAGISGGAARFNPTLSGLRALFMTAWICYLARRQVRRFFFGTIGSIVNAEPGEQPGV